MPLRLLAITSSAPDLYDAESDFSSCGRSQEGMSSGGKDYRKFIRLTALCVVASDAAVCLREDSVGGMVEMTW